ncbi:hypothetical protein APSETT444_007398 [Aspergillus pseudonomiae]
MKNQPRTRASTIGLGMEPIQGAKSLVIILYQLLTEHVAALRKWGSLKAYTILNALEIVFWAAVAVLTIQANVQMCVAPGCILGWGVAITGINLSMTISPYMRIPLVEIIGTDMKVVLDLLAAIAILCKVPFLASVNCVWHWLSGLHLDVVDVVAEDGAAT